MNAAICTVYEGHYHYGVAALTNSLYHQGYRGAVYAGYRGASLPAWAAEARSNPALGHSGAQTLDVAEGLELHFLPIDTDHHFAYYKPDFMLYLLDQVVPAAEAIFYFDPDIVVSTPWTAFEGWVECGVALCEDVNSPMPERHPVRTAWRRYFAEKEFTLKFKDAIYANAGFVGVSRRNKGFLRVWQQLQEAMAPAVGGLNQNPFSGAVALPFSPFNKCDQDAMNAAVEAWDGTVSFVGKDGMAFGSGAHMMAHAIGSCKPWLWKPLAQVAAGHPPRRADREYWRLAHWPIASQPSGLVRRRKLAIQVAALIGRFYSRK